MWNCLHVFGEAESAAGFRFHPVIYLPSTTRNITFLKFTHLFNRFFLNLSIFISGISLIRYATKKISFTLFLRYEMFCARMHISASND